MHFENSTSVITYTLKGITCTITKNFFYEKFTYSVCICVVHLTLSAQDDGSSMGAEGTSSARRCNTVAQHF